MFADVYTLLKRPLFSVGGFQIAVWMIIAAVAAVMVYNRMRR